MREVINGIAGEAPMKKEVSRKKSRFVRVVGVNISLSAGSRVPRPGEQPDMAWRRVRWRKV